MAITIKQAYDLLLDTDQLKIMEAAAVRVAYTVLAEDAGTPRHAERLILASRIVNNPAGWGRTFAYAVITDDAFLALNLNQIVANYGIAVVQARILAVFNAYLEAAA